MVTAISKSKSQKKRVIWPLREWRQLNQNREILGLFFPGFLYILIFSYLPMFGVILAFKRYRYDQGILGSEWVGFENFTFFFVSEDAWRITRNTVLYEIGYIFLTMAFALLFAILLNEIGRRTSKIYQTALFIPYFLSWVVVSYISYAFLDQQTGYLNTILHWFGMEPHNWYLEKEPWPIILNIASLWKKVGFSALVYYAGIMSINQEYYEAAKIDGATRFQMAIKITIPMLAPLITIMLILAVGGIFHGDFGLHYFIPNNQGMTYPTTDIIDTYVYRALRTVGDVGMSSAVGLYQSVVGMVLVIATNAIVRKLNQENSLW
ncbi:ABC transporter permease [Paenibacillus silviterrae]|uniref:ABC transporter permease n=1 Tax=Paenibacillus silviterrae TaxID=3242194 RepID=UPI0025430D62|nr:ABC transporter permease subunit [Paenibacillus chinjuensis]